MFNEGFWRPQIWGLNTWVLKGTAMSRDARDQLVKDNLPLVGHLVRTVYFRSAMVSQEDLVAAGFLALVLAADSYQPERGVPFGAYARRRILGAFLDEMRSEDWASRTIRQRAKQTAQAKEQLEANLGRRATVGEIASSMGLEPSFVIEGLADASRVLVPFEDDSAIRSDVLPPEEAAERVERVTRINRAIDALPENLRYVIRAIYFDDRTVQSVATELGVTHSAVSQQRARGVRMLREGLTRFFGTEQESTSTSQATALARSAYRERPNDPGRRVPELAVA